ncbi:Hypothetical predicted protein [Mytilus galloprovincialis]|uniref:Uncharacterized protein n=1 Tax=Mytilus galloprovincialis TaxID=29158 RepID=A0A8B6DEZ7_MYTGA|nr:Hypothetical predicted protein [Mytilus galloprovincialis]
MERGKPFLTPGTAIIVCQFRRGSPSDYLHYTLRQISLQDGSTRLYSFRRRLYKTKHCSCKGSEPFCCNTGWRITLVGSRFTHPAESRYAPVEGEALAVVDALDNFQS